MAVEALEAIRRTNTLFDLCRREENERMNLSKGENAGTTFVLTHHHKRSFLRNSLNVYYITFVNRKIFIEFTLGRKTISRKRETKEIRKK
jgi:hypothetical protein